MDFQPKQKVVVDPEKLSTLRRFHGTLMELVGKVGEVLNPQPNNRGELEVTWPGFARSLFVPVSVLSHA